MFLQGTITSILANFTLDKWKDYDGGLSLIGSQCSIWPCLDSVSTSCKTTSSNTILSPHVGKPKYQDHVISFWHLMVDSQWIIVQLSFSRYAFLSDYLTDLKLHRTKSISSKIAPSGVWTHNLRIISLILYQLS